MPIFSVNGSLITFPSAGFIDFGAQSGGGGGNGGGSLQPLTLTARANPLSASDTFTTALWPIASGGSGPYTYGFNDGNGNLVQSVAFSGGYYYFMNNQTLGQCTFDVNSGPPIAGTTDTLNVMVKDANGNTATFPLSITYLPANANIIRPSPWDYFVTDAAVPNQEFLSVQVALAGFTNNATTSFSDPSGYFTINWFGIGGGYIHPASGTTWPPPGVYPITFNISEGGNSFSEIINVHIISGGIADIVWLPAPVLSTSLPSGFIVGQVEYSGDSDNTYDLGIAPQSMFAISQTGVVSFTTPPTTPGSYPMTITVIDGDLTTTSVVSINVVQGTIVDPSYMTANIPSNLNNSMNSGVLTTPSITQFTPNQWVLNGPYGIGTRYSINATTGVVDIVGPLSYQIAADGTDFTDQLFIIATDGINTCSKMVTVPVAAVTGPTIYIIPTDMVNPPTVSGPVYHSLTAAFSAIGINNVVAGTIFQCYPSPTRNYYVNDGCNTASGIGCCGQITQRVPVTVMGAPGYAFPAFSGSDGAKGFFDGTNFDLFLRNIEIFAVTTFNGNNLCGVYKEAGCSSGNITIDNFYIHDCDNGIARGCPGAKIFATNGRVSHCGIGEFGFTHNFYVEADLVYAYNVLSDTSINGHIFKTRSQNTIIKNCRLLDGQLGSASNIVDIPQGGLSSIVDCILHKGPNSQNPFMVKFADPNDQNNLFGSSAEGRHNTLTVTGSTFLFDPGEPGLGNIMPGMNTSNAGLTEVFGIMNSSEAGGVDGIPASVIASNNSFYGLLSSQYTGVQSIRYAQNGSIIQIPPGTNTVTDSTTLTPAQRPALDYSFPGPGPDPTIANPPGPFFTTWAGGNGGGQLTSPANIPVIAAGSPAGTEIFQLVWLPGNTNVSNPVFGINYQSGPNSATINSSTGVVSLSATGVANTTQSDVIGVTVNGNVYIWNLAYIVR